MPDQNTFFGFIIEKYISFLNDLVKEPASFSLFKKPSVAIETKLESDGAVFQCLPSLPEVKEENPGTFVSQQEGRILVYRNPSPFKLELQLLPKQGVSKDYFRYFDKWFSYFFDNRSIDAFIPPFIIESLDLSQKMRSMKAEIRIQRGQSPGTMAFTYQHLYHSGNPLREEQKTKQRIIQIHEVVS